MATRAQQKIVYRKVRWKAKKHPYREISAPLRKWRFYSQKHQGYRCHDLVSALSGWNPWE